LAISLPFEKLGGGLKAETQKAEHKIGGIQKAE
jgi:hypothetical protein